MRSLCLRVGLILGLALAGAEGLQAGCLPASLRPLVLPGAKTAYLLKADLGLSAGALQWSAATHGLVIDGFDRLIYSPNASFWDVGVDSIVVTTPGRNDLPKTVQWVLAMRPGVASIEDFENPAHPNWDLESFDPAAISALGKLSGNLGLRFTTTSPGGQATATLEDPGDTNGATAGGGAVAGWQPPGGGGPQNGTCGSYPVCPTGAWYPFLEADMDNDGQAEHTVYVKEFGDVVQVGLSPGEGLELSEVPGVVTTVSRKAHILELAQWPAADNRNPGAAVWIDGRHALEIEDTQGRQSFMEPEPEPGSAFTFVGVPATFTTGGTALAHSFDNLAIFNLVAAPRFDCLALDGFDSGVWDSDWTAINGANLSVNSSAALVGKLGLDVQLFDFGAGNGGLLTLQELAGRDRYGLKLRFDPRGVESEVGGTLNLALGLQTLAAPRPFSAVLKRNASGFVVQIQSRDDVGGAKMTPVAISNAAHVLELDWQRSTTTHVGTGNLRAWLDGVLVAEHLNLDNDSEWIAEIRVGGLGTPGAVKGHLLLDQVEAWAQAFPGPFEAE
ncbi:MAG TPA: hypothetical protein VGS22_13295 [Thermoanaerobaculia bacterium]|jgi:hypothetical protein|nr:hypothetical protein [Thermoanaerobaculia bacterium]